MRRLAEERRHFTWPFRTRGAASTPYCYVPVPSFQHQGLQSTGSSTTPGCILWTGARPITFTYGKSPRQGDIGTTRATTSIRSSPYFPPSSRVSHRRWFGASSSTRSTWGATSMRWGNDLVRCLKRPQTRLSRPSTPARASPCPRSARRYRAPFQFSGAGCTSPVAHFYRARPS